MSFIQFKGKEYYYSQGYLDLAGAEITDIAEIEGLHKLLDLVTLDLGNNHIAEIKGLSAFTKLQRLYLNHNRITEIKGLDTLTNLQKLFLNNNQITEIKGLGTLTNLRELQLKLNPITEREQNLLSRSAQEIVTYCRNKKLEIERQERERKAQQEREQIEKEQEKVRQAQQEHERKENEERFEKEAVEKVSQLLKIASKIKIEDLGEMLGLKRKVLFDKVIAWSSRFPIKIDGDYLIVQDSDVDAFVKALDGKFDEWGKKTTEKIEKKGIIYLENFKIIMFAATIKAPPIIVNIESALKNIIVFIVAIIGSKYDNITMFPPLSFLTPTL